MSGIRGTKNPMPKAGGKPTGMFSGSGKQKNPPVGDKFKPELTGARLRMARKDPVSRGKK